MTNLLTVLPDFDAKPFTHLLPSLERALISAADLLTLGALDVAKRAQVPPGEVKKLSDALLEGLQANLYDLEKKHSNNEGNDAEAGIGSSLAVFEPCRSISTLDDTLDATFNGGIATEYLTEIVGER